MAFTLPDLPYPTDALEPAVDQRTMEIHHGKHHQTYVTKLNAAVEGTEFARSSLDDLIRHLADVPESIRTAVRSNGGGHWNHSFFWTVMAPPDEGGAPEGELKTGLDRDLRGVDAFYEEFSAAAVNRFGSGWAWLCSDPAGKLSVCSTPNQDNPLTDSGDGSGSTPLLCIDVWEHAYYLKYQNRRPDYIAAFRSIINWKQVAENYASVLSHIG